MLQSIIRLYRFLRLDSYRHMFGALRERDGSLSATEAFSADIIHLLGMPTLSQFAACIGISQPNATYKVNTLVTKGYVRKTVSPTDRREVRLCPSEKFSGYLRENSAVLQRAVEQLQQEYSQQELNLTANVLKSLTQLLSEEEAT